MDITLPELQTIHSAQVFEAFLSRPSRCVVEGLADPIACAVPPLFLGHAAALEQRPFRGAWDTKGFI